MSQKQSKRIRRLERELASVQQVQTQIKNKLVEQDRKITQTTLSARSNELALEAYRHTPNNTLADILAVLSIVAVALMIVGLSISILSALGLM